MAILTALAAIVLTAYMYHNQPLPNWPYGLSINSLLAIYVVVLKAAMLLILAKGLTHLKWTWFRTMRPLDDLARYDDASRGPTGSLWLLFGLYGRDIISSIGALTIIAAVVLDPMAQQVIRYFNCSRISPSTAAALPNATIPRTNSYSESGRHTIALESTVPSGLQSAINGGVFVPGSIVPFECRSGNCTFPQVYHTLGYVSNCVDAGNEVQLSNVTFPTTSTFSGIYSNGTAYNQTSTFEGWTFSATLPSGIGTNYTASGSTTGIAPYYMVMDYDLSTSSIELVVGPDAVSLYSPPDCGKSTAANWTCRGYGAARCTLRPAVLAIKSAIKAGRLQETITMATDQFNAAGANMVEFSTAEVSCLDPTQQTLLEGLGYEFPPNLQWLPYNVSYLNGEYSPSAGSNLSVANASIVPSTCIYSGSVVSVTALNDFFANYFNAAVYAYGSAESGDNVGLAFYNSRNVSFETVDRMFANIAASMTTYVRQHGDVNMSAPAIGEVWTTETCIHVRWGLLSYPAALAFLTIFFFVAMVSRTMYAQEGIHHDLKGSPLALLFHGLDEDTWKRVNAGAEIEKVSELSKVRQEMLVQFRLTSTGWKFADETKAEG